jgi:hypothetical protein
MSISAGGVRVEGEPYDKEPAMAQYLLNIIQPDQDPPPAEVLEPIMKNVLALRDQMKAANVWVFSGGLHRPSTSTVVHVKDGETLVTDGPFVEGKEHVGGFTVIRVPDLDAALGWARKLAQVLAPLSIEVRPFVDGHG